jgi:hypothetical protein
MKIVINSCYGGFSLSPKGERRYLELKGLNPYFYRQTKYKFNDGKTEFIRIDHIDDVPDLFFYCTTYDQGKTLPDFPEDIFHSRDLKRSDPILVQVVEELGAESFGACAKLRIVDIDKGRWFKIDEYDGYESIQYRDIDDEWILAE